MSLRVGGEGKLCDNTLDINSLESSWEQKRAWTYEVIKTTLISENGSQKMSAACINHLTYPQAKEEIWIRSVRYFCDGAVRQHELVSLNGINGEAVLVC